MIDESINQYDSSHDFDFLVGIWQVKNKRLPKYLQGSSNWETFETTCTTQLILGGLGNTDEIVAKNWKPGFIGMSLRLYNPTTKLWSIYWADNQRCTLDPPVVGKFSNGVGVFEGSDTFEGKPILMRFTWSNITTATAHWQQEFSDDNGQSWEKNWIMEFTRA